MKAFAKQLLKAFLIILLGTVAGYLLLVLVYQIPVKTLFSKVEVSRDSMNYLYEVIPGWTGSRLDNYMDSAMVLQAISDPDKPLLEKIICNYQVSYYQGYPHEKNLTEYLDGTPDYQYMGYSHYWGGHLVYLKPLLLFLSLKNIRYLGLLFQGVLLALIVSGLSREKDMRFAVIPLTIAVFSASPVTMTLSFQLCDVYFIALITAVVILFGYRKISPERMYLVFLLSGMCVSYFDFLTYPFFALGIPMCILLACMYHYDRSVSFKAIFGHIVKNSFFWCMGYAGFWMAKWISATILMPSVGSWEMAVNSLLYRGGRDTGDVTLNLFMVVKENLKVYVTSALILVIAAAVIVYLVFILRNRAWSKEILKWCAAFFLVALFPLVWYRLAENHSYVHAYMQFRELAIATCAGLMMMALPACSGEKKR